MEPKKARFNGVTQIKGAGTVLAEEIRYIGTLL